MRINYSLVTRNPNLMNEDINVRYEKRVPTVSEFRELRKDAGWPMPPASDMSEALDGTVFGVCARTGKGETVGMGRVVGDGKIQLFITDVVVRTEWQNNGVGAGIMEHLLEQIQEHASPEAIIGLFSAYGCENFYEKFGFIPRPAHDLELGPGMILQKD